MRAAFVASCLRGALPPVLLRAVCLVRAIVLGVVLLYVECCCVLAESGGESIGPETSRSRHLGPWVDCYEIDLPIDTSQAEPAQLDTQRHGACGRGAMEVPRLRHLRDALHTGNVDVAQAWAAMEADFDDDEEDVRSPAPIAIAAGPPLL